MAKTTKNDVFLPEVFNDAVAYAFAQKTVFMDSPLAQMNAVVTDGSFDGGADAIGNEIKIPYFGALGDFEENVPDGTPATPKKLGQTLELATVTRDTLAFEVTRWARNAMGGDPYKEAANQVAQAARRQMDKRLIAAAVATGGLVKDVYNAGTPAYLTYDLLVDAKMMFGDEQEDVVGMMVHSKALADLYKLKDSVGRPLLTDPRDGELPRFLGLPVGVSDRLPLTGSSMGTVTSTGTSPPVVTLAGTPNAGHELRIIISTGGSSNGTAKFKFSTDGGTNYSAEITIPNGGGAIALTDTAQDSLVGVNGATGITATFANGTYNVDNVYTAKAALKARSLVVKRNALAFWYNRAALALQTDRDILADTSLAAVHLYGAAHRYRRVPGGTKPGIVTIAHNVGFSA